MTKLATVLTNGNISFFGKIYGSEKDYYVVEATEIDPRKISIMIMIWKKEKKMELIKMYFL